MDKNKKLCELLGIEWREPYNIKEWEYYLPDDGTPYYTIFDPQDGTEPSLRKIIPENPDFLSDSGRIELLRIMEKREDWLDFLKFSRKYYHDFSIVGSVNNFILFFTEPQGGTKLVDAVIEFVQKRKK